MAGKKFTLAVFLLGMLGAAVAQSAYQSPATLCAKCQAPSLNVSYNIQLGYNGATVQAGELSLTSVTGLALDGALGPGVVSSGSIDGGGFGQTGGLSTFSDEMGDAGPASLGGWARNLIGNFFRNEVRAWHDNYVGNHVAVGVNNVQASLRRMQNDPIGAAIAMAIGSAGGVDEFGQVGAGGRVALRIFNDPAYGLPEFQGNPWYAYEIRTPGFGQGIGGIDNYIKGDTAYLEDFHIETQLQDQHLGTEAYQLWESRLPASVKTIKLSPALDMPGRFGTRDARPFWLKMGFKDAPRGAFARSMIKTLP